MDTVLIENYILSTVTQCLVSNSLSVKDDDHYILMPSEIICNLCDKAILKLSSPEFVEDDVQVD